MLEPVPQCSALSTGEAEYWQRPNLGVPTECWRVLRRRGKMPVCDICGEEFKNAQGLTGHRRMAHGAGAPAPAEGQERSIVPTRALPLEAVVARLRLPEVPVIYDGMREAYVTGFNEGTRCGINTVLTGIRAAQELSAIGVAQGKPLIEMAKELRAGEAEAVRQAVGEAMAHIDGRLAQLETRKPDIAFAPDPMKGVMGRMMERLTDTVMDMFAPRPPGQPGQPTAPQGWQAEKGEGDV